MTEGMERHEHEREPYSSTGVFGLSRGSSRFNPLSGESFPSAWVPVFAVKEIPIVCTRDGWREFAVRLTEVTGIGTDLAREGRLMAVEQGPFEPLTESMQPGEIRIVEREEFSEAHIRKFGTAIIIPAFW